jgi:hypothetical protein
MRFLAPPHQWFLKLAFLKIELWVYALCAACSVALVCCVKSKSGVGMIPKYTYSSIDTYFMLSTGKLMCLITEVIFLCPFLCVFCADVFARCALMWGHALSVLYRRFFGHASLPPPPPPRTCVQSKMATLLLMASPTRALAR